MIRAIVLIRICFVLEDKIAFNVDAQVTATFFQFVDADRLSDGQMIAGDPAQDFQIGTTTEIFSHIRRQRTHIGSTRARHVECEFLIT